MSRQDLTELWNKAKELLKNETTIITFETWIQPLEIKSINDNVIVLVDFYMQFQRDTLSIQDILDLLTNTFNFLTNKDCTATVFIKRRIRRLR
jgi:chromosomal replication initiation ATPase DnaA